jgi:hypothetical protein
MKTGVAITYSARACFTVGCFKACGILSPRGLAVRPLPEARGIILWLTREPKGETTTRKACPAMSECINGPVGAALCLTHGSMAISAWFRRELLGEMNVGIKDGQSNIQLAWSTLGFYAGSFARAAF